MKFNNHKINKLIITILVFGIILIKHEITLVYLFFSGIVSYVCVDIIYNYIMKQTINFTGGPYKYAPDNRQTQIIRTLIFICNLFLLLFIGVYY